MKKKVLALSLVVAMVVMNSVVVLGATEKIKGKNDSTTGNQWKYYNSLDQETTNTKPVNVTFTSADTAVYSVDIEWGSMTFKYTQGLWQSNHTYASSVWKVDSQEDNNIKVINHSNRGVNVTMSASLSDTISNGTNKVKGEFKDIKTDDSTGTTISCSASANNVPEVGPINLSKGILNDASNADYCRKELNINGDIEQENHTANDPVKVGLITITLEQ